MFQAATDTVQVPAVTDHLPLPVTDRPTHPDAPDALRWPHFAAFKTNFKQWETETLSVDRSSFVSIWKVFNCLKSFWILEIQKGNEKLFYFEHNYQTNALSGRFGLKRWSVEFFKGYRMVCSLLKFDWNWLNYFELIEWSFIQANSIRPPFISAHLQFNQFLDGI